MKKVTDALTLDHVELFVPDRHEAAAWYSRLGLEIVEECRAWAEDPRGPLMISSDGGVTKLALFTGQPQGARETSGFHRVAFAVDQGTSRKDGTEPKRRVLACSGRVRR